MPLKRPSARCAAGWCFVLLLAAMTPGPAAASGFKDIYKFPYCVSNCRNLGSPNLPVEDGSGNLWGTIGGFTADPGAIFELEHKAGGKYVFNLLYSFCSEPHCVDGEFPQGQVVRDKEGNLYGTVQDVINDYGRVFELTSDGTYKVLYTFCSARNCADGGLPDAGLTYAGQQSGAPYDGKSPLYGTAALGGNPGCEGLGCGVVFELKPGKGGWAYSVAYSFCAVANCADGGAPNGPVLIDSSGTLYGTTNTAGSAKSAGVAFALSFANGKWSENTLYTFCSLAKCRDGAYPVAPLVEDASGNLYGTAEFGGRGWEPNDPFSGGGTLFRLSLVNNVWSETTLYSFCRLKNCTDGESPVGPLAIDRAGNLFGITALGGYSCRFNCESGGVLFEYSGNSYSVLHKFCRDETDECPDGVLPAAGVMFNGSGTKLIGTAGFGGGNGYAGTIFEQVP